jgi:hypothetical protein
LFETARMRADAITLSLALAVLALATFAVQRPYEPAIHRWEAALAVALVAIILVIVSLRGVFGSRRERFAALGGLGGVVIAVAFLAAELLVGPPQRILSAPGQTYRPPSSAHVAIIFPAVAPGDLERGTSPSSLNVVTGKRILPLGVGQQLRVHSYVLRADNWPAAYVQTWSAQHVAQTVTQPAGVAFVSPVLQFPIADKDGLLTDSFAVPALHRSVRLKYYPGLPSRGIDIPFLQLEIDEENGGSLFGGVAVSGKILRQAGMELRFDLGTYPVVSIAGAPDQLVYSVGAALIVLGIIGFALFTLMPGTQKK